MAGEIASAYLTIYPRLDAKSVTAEVERAMGGAGTSAGHALADGVSRAASGAMGTAGTSAGDSFASGFSAAKVALGNIIGELAMSAANEFKERFSDGIEQSDALAKFFSTMQFAGIDDGQITAVMQSMRDYADQTVYDLGEVLNTTAKLAANGVADYDQLVQAAGNLNAAAGGNSETFGYFANAITQVNGAGKLMSQDWNQIVNALPGASGAIQNELREMGAWDESMGTFRDAMAAGEISADEFNAALTNLGMSDVAKEAATNASTFEGAMGQLDAAVTNVMMGIYDSLNEDGRITDFINGMADAFADAQPAIEGIADAFGDFVEFIAPAVPVIAGIAAGIAAVSGITAVIGAISGAVAFLTGVVGPALAMIGSVPGLIAVITTVLGGPITIIAAVIGAIVAFLATNEGARKKVVEVFGAIKSTIYSAFTAVKNTISNVANFIRTAIPAAMAAMRQAVTNGVNNVRTAFTSLKGKVTGALSGAASWLTSAGRNIIQGLVNGIRNATGWVTNAIQSVCSNAVGALKSFFGIHSPSTLMAEMGEYMMAGLANGIDDGSKGAVGAMRDASASVAGALGLDGRNAGTTFGVAATGTKGGTTYNVSLNGIAINDDAGIRNATRGYLTELARLGAI